MTKMCGHYIWEYIILKEAQFYRSTCNIWVIVSVLALEWQKELIAMLNMILIIKLYKQIVLIPG